MASDESIGLLGPDAGVLLTLVLESLCICHNFERKALACLDLTPGHFWHRYSNSVLVRLSSWAPDSRGAKTFGKIGGVPD